MRKLKLIATLSLVLTITLCSCGANNEGTEIEQTKQQTDNTLEDDTLDKSEVVSTANTFNIFEHLSTNYVSATVNSNYQEPIYNLSSNHQFTFECSEQAGYVAYKAFKVYDNKDFSNGRTYNINTYENGVITVSPDSVVKLSDIGSRDINDGTWGSLNQLYLVQYIDLNTGLDLEEPIITPFTVQHELSSPALSHGVDSNNNYKLTWSEVDGADKYVVFEYSNNIAYDVVAVTTETSINVNKFEEQKKNNQYDALIKQDLLNAGYTVDSDGITHMNSAVKYSDTLKDGHFVVVAFGSNGESSGVSNIVDVRDIANKLPYKVADNVVNINIESVMDIPTYVDVKMIDGSIAKMIINYHGAQTYKYPDDTNKMSIKAHVANTEFDSFVVTLHGMTYEDIMRDVKYITERQDKLLEKVSTGEDTSLVVTVTDDDSEINVDIPEAPVVTEAPAEKSIPMQLAAEVAKLVDERLNLIGVDKVDKIIYGDTTLEAWISYCLVAQSEVVPVPLEMFPEAADTDYLCEIFIEAYRQNPTCGVIDVAKVLYNPDYQALVIPYIEDSETRLSKTVKEINKAFELANQITNSSMSEYDKVYALNEYFRTNCSYDTSSAATDVDLYSLSEQFLDSHAPIGILCNNYGVCESYSEAFVLTARAAGLNALCETGAIYGGPHEWNRVQIDGKWCILDITNNDTDSIINGLMNVTDEQVTGILVPDQTAIYNDSLVSANDSSKEYYYVNGLDCNSAEDAKNILVNQLNSSNTAVVRLPNTATTEDASSIAKVVMQELKTNLSEAYVAFNILYLSK